MRPRHGLDSDSKRHRSRFDQEPSPKKFRRDGKAETEQLPASLEARSATSPKLTDKVERMESDWNTNGQRYGTKHSSAPTEVSRSRSRSYFQHDDRGHGGQVGRSFDRKVAAERGWWRDSRYQRGARETNKITNDMPQTDEKSQAQGNNDRAWHHDRYLEAELDQKQPRRKRPSFQEKKIVADLENFDKTKADPLKPSHRDRPVVGTDRREGRESYHLDRREKLYAGGRNERHREGQRGTFNSRDLSDAAVGAREGFPGTGRRQYRPSEFRVEKWKHDLFDETDRSPNSKKEEDQIAKIEALLAS